MSLVNDTVIDQLIDTIDIAEYIGQYVDLHEKGGELWGLSPFTDEATPSFSVNPENGYFFDFSAGFGGTVIRFAMAYHRLSFKEAVASLMTYAGMSESDLLVSGSLEASRVMRRYKPSRRSGKQKLSKKLADNFMDRFEHDTDKLSPWVEEGISPEVLDLFQVRYDAFFDRIVFPVRDMEGNIINVIGRTLDPDFKAKGISKYQPYMEFGYLDTIAGYWENREHIHRQKEIILFEGLKSVMLCRTWGICNTGAIMTSHLSPHLLRLLIPMGVRVVFALDAGVDVRKDRNIKKLMRFTDVEAVMNYGGLLENKMAPVDRGLEIWQVLYERRTAPN